MRRFILIALCGAALPMMLPAADRTEGEMFATRSVVHARHGMGGASSRMFLASTSSISLFLLMTRLRVGDPWCFQ